MLSRADVLPHCLFAMPARSSQRAYYARGSIAFEEPQFFIVSIVKRGEMSKEATSYSAPTRRQNRCSQR